MAAFDNELILVKEVFVTSKLGEQEQTASKRTVFCAERSVYKSEKTFARQSGLAAKHVLKVHNFEYEGETLAEYNGKRFTISDVAVAEDETAELTLSLKVGGTDE